MNVIKIIALALLGTVSLACESEKSTSSISHIKDTKTKQYAIEGKTLYEQNCSNCHQSDGTGLGRVIPPLAQADFMLEDQGRTARLIRYGIKGEITVNGVQYNQNMPANTQLTPIEIAQIMTYIYNVWGNDEGLVSASDVEKFLAD
ncbi:cytochrome c [Litoribacter alkaliphilus]|uniref:Cytochrome c n=1 Tax=Litoribacter ruber TaxID=702568 RepID=A0AAP2CHR7_9BACT|nr:cytochrome c [Litoribacter alkaliphilus]MBS9524943.1 cytochrome c [Litoribacter alkaliphilus]